VQGHLGWTCTAHEPVHAVGKESCAPLYCAPSPTRTYLGTGDHLGEPASVSKGAVLARTVGNNPLSPRVSSPWHLAQVVLSLSSKGPPISPPMSAISPWPTRRAEMVPRSTRRQHHPQRVAQVKVRGLKLICNHSFGAPASAGSC
jgi:hypothetical protein